MKQFLSVAVGPLKLVWVYHAVVHRGEDLFSMWYGLGLLVGVVNTLNSVAIVAGWIRGRGSEPRPR